MSELLYSKECFTVDELRALGRRALDILTRTEHGREMAQHLLSVTLAQGAALHYAVQTGNAVRYLDPTRAGVKDIDIWCFFAAGEREFNPRWKQNDDYGPSRFGRSPEDRGYLGRRIDVFGRSIPVRKGERVDESIRRWLQRPGKGSPYYLLQKAVVGLYPGSLIGEVIWINPELAEETSARGAQSGESHPPEDQATAIPAVQQLRPVERDAAGSARSRRVPRARELAGRNLRIAAHVRGNPRQPYTHGWLAFEVLRRADGGSLSFEDYRRGLFHPSAEISRLAIEIPGVQNAYQDLKHIRHDIRLGRVLVD